MAPLESDDEERTSLAGMQKALSDHGFDMVEIVLRKNWAKARRLPDLEAAAFTLQESVLERLEGELATAAAVVRAAQREAALMTGVRKGLEEARDKPFRERGAALANAARAAELRRWTVVTEAIRQWAEGAGSGAIT